MAMGSQPASMGWGADILAIDSRASCSPTATITSATATPEMYSILPCPNGCPGSGFLEARRKPASVITDEPASDRLLKASAVTAMEPESIPARYLPAKSSMLRNMPTQEQSTP